MDELKDIDLKAYSPSAKTKQLIKDTRILLLVGPTGSGKDTLARELLKTNHYHAIVTHTTRPPRHNHGVIEKDGQDYHFINLATARKLLDGQEFVEAAMIHGNLYATSAAEFAAAKRESKIGVTDLDVQGVRSYKRLSPKAIAVFLLPPSFNILLARIARRYGHSNHDKDIIIRLNTALDELYELLNTDYYYGVINDNLDQTIKIVEQIVSTNHHDRQTDQQAKKQAKNLIADIKNYLAGQSSTLDSRVLDKL